MLDAEFEHQLVEVTMNVAGDNDTLGFRICERKYVCHDLTAFIASFCTSGCWPYDYWDLTILDTYAL